jgi:stearoyl-CoA desaturase (delta-9 desaturase)
MSDSTVVPACPSWSSRLLAWFDSHRAGASYRDDDTRVDWLRNLPFFAIHLACLAVIWVGWSWTAVAVCVGLYLLRMFAITAVYHRLLAHRAYEAPRWLAFLGAAVANSSGQRGPLWWAAHHRIHHRESDSAADVHSPIRSGFMRSHMLWFMTPGAFRTRLEAVPDLARRPELVWLDRFDNAAPAVLGFATFLAGWACEVWAPGLGTDRWQLFIWGFCISTVLCAHATFTVNSLAHTWGSRPFATSDGSRNNALIALLTLGEGWHNNHHRYAASAAQGFRWWQLDPTLWTLRGMAAVGLVRGLRPVPERIVAEGYGSRP